MVRMPASYPALSKVSTVPATVTVILNSFAGLVTNVVPGISGAGEGGGEERRRYGAGTTPWHRWATANAGYASRALRLETIRRGLAHADGAARTAGGARPNIGAFGHTAAAGPTAYGRPAFAVVKLAAADCGARRLVEPHVLAGLLATRAAPGRTGRGRGEGVALEDIAHRGHRKAAHVGQGEAGHVHQVRARRHLAAIGRRGDRRGRGPIGKEVGGAAAIHPVLIAVLQCLAPREECALGPRHAYIGADLINAAVALHHVECGAARNLLALLSTERGAGIEPIGDGDIELAVPKLQGFAVRVGVAG